MRIYPFESYLSYFPNSYAETEVSREKLKDFEFPVNPEILESMGMGLIPIRRNGHDYFNVRELIGYARMYSIPDEGYISKKPIRSAEILETEIREDEKTGEQVIKTVYVACAFMPSHDKRRCSGQVVFICPFCGCLHCHGADGEKFGDGDGDRVPHCHCDIPAFYRLNTQKYGLFLDRNWHFHLVETEDFKRARDFPKYLAKELVNRRKG